MDARCFRAWRRVLGVVCFWPGTQVEVLGVLEHNILV